MAFSTQSAVSDGTLVSLLLTIKYIDQQDVTVFIDDVEQVVDVDYTWVTDNSIEFAAAVPLGGEVLLVRRTQLAQVLNVFSSGATFNNATMDENFEQLLFVAQEAQEGGNLTDIFNDVDMHGNTLLNLPKAVDPTSPVTLKQLNEDYAADSSAVLRQDLLTQGVPTKAAGQVAFDSSVAYPQGTVGNAVVSILAAVGQTTPQQFGAIADGTSHPLSEFYATLAGAQAVYPHATALTNEIDWAATQAALNAGSARVHVGEGHYVLNLSLTRTTDITLTGDGAATILDFSSGAGQLLIAGSLTPMAQLSVGPSRHTRALTWATPHGLAPRDVVVLWNPTDYSWFGRRAEYRDGAFLRVHSITDANNVFLYDPCPDAYVAANMNVYKMNYVQATVRDITCVASSASEVAPLTLRHCVDSTVEGFSYYGGIYAGLQIDRCYNVAVQASSPINASPFVNNEYGTVVANSTHVTISGKGMYATRHAVSVGGTALEATPPNRYVRISNMSVLGGSSNTNAADAHGNSDYTTYDGCFILGGAGVAGRNPTVRNCTIIGETGGAFADRKGMYTAECNGGTVTIENTVIDTTGDGNTEGFIHFILLGPGEDNPLGTGLKSNFNLVVRNVTILAPNAHANAKAVRVLSRNTNRSVNVSIDGLNVVAPNLLAFLYLEETILATVPGEFLIVDNVYGPSGASIVHPTASIAARSTREMQQSGFEDVAVATGVAFAVGVGATFRYKYSRLPAVSITHSAPTGVAQQQWGGKTVASFAYAVTANTVRGGIRSTDNTNFTTADNVRFNYVASVGQV